jgi:hypothetical protein
VQRTPGDCGGVDAGVRDAVQTRVRQVEQERHEQTAARRRWDRCGQALTGGRSQTDALCAARRGDDDSADCELVAARAKRQHELSSVRRQPHSL